MSTKSKRRISARKWKAKHHADALTTIERAAREAYARGAEAMKRDMQLLVSHPDTAYRDPRGDHTTSIIEFPSDPRECAGNLVVPFPRYVSPIYGRVPSHYDRVHFRAVEYAWTRRNGSSSSTIRWFNWEPEEGGGDPDVQKERTSILFHGMGKLAHATSMVEDMAQWRAPELAPVAELLRSCFDELRRRLGRYAPLPYELERGLDGAHPSERNAFYFHQLREQRHPVR